MPTLSNKIQKKIASKHEAGSFKGAIDTGLDKIQKKIASSGGDFDLRVYDGGR